MENQVEMFKCHICNESEFDSKQKLSVHQTHCKLKHPDRVERSKRVPLGTKQQRFVISEEDRKKFRYRILNDNWKIKPDRIQEAMSAGYEIVDHERSGETAGTNEDGSEIKGVLMRQPIEFYEEDQAEKDREIDKVDEQIYRGEFKTEGPTYKPGSGIKTEVKLTG